MVYITCNEYLLNIRYILDSVKERGPSCPHGACNLTEWTINGKQDLCCSERQHFYKGLKHSTVLWTQWPQGLRKLTVSWVLVERFTRKEGKRRWDLKHPRQVADKTHGVHSASSPDLKLQRFTRLFPQLYNSLWREETLPGSCLQVSPCSLTPSLPPLLTGWGLRMQP